jgi:Pyruvate/2-oxoacid:ferredoxin oxidoreductase delta subunit
VIFLAVADNPRLERICGPYTPIAEGNDMCEFCVQHGEGKKWYLQTKNYSDDLLSDVRRRRFIEEFADPAAVRREVARSAQLSERLEKVPRFIRNVVNRLVTRKMKRIHFGQVVPIEEIEQIFGFTNSIVRVPCICRSTTLGEEKRYCYGVSLEANGGKLAEIVRGLEMTSPGGPDTANFETLSKEEAVSSFRSHEHEGLCHTVWTFYTPFIGGICNCDRSDCLAMRSTVTQSVPVMFRAEYVAQVNPDECSGCRECMRLCQFGAVTYSASNKKASIDQRWCYGCGICRSVCKKNAIRLEERSKVPVAANLW